MKNGPYQGNVKIGKFSSLRKLMRAARRGKVPSERQVIIDAAMRSANSMPDNWLNSHARDMNALVRSLPAAERQE